MEKQQMVRYDTKNKVIFTLERLPLMLIAGLAGFSVAVMALLLVGQFKTQLIWTVALAGALVCGWIPLRFGEAKRPGTAKAQVVCDLLVLVGVLVWGVGNVFFTSQHIVTDRDPATYAVTSAWLAKHDDFKVNAGVDEEIIELKQVGAGFSIKKNGDETVLNPQGQHLLPALLGAMGKVVGQVRVMHLNILFGMTALLAVYSLGRLLIRPYWALVATGVMASSFPLIYFSRDTYTEPLALTFTFGGLALLFMAQQSRRLLLWALAGLVAGASVLVRIDGYLSLIGLAVFFILYMVVGERGRGMERLRRTAAFWLPVAIMGGLAWLDLKLYSEAYLRVSQKLMVYEMVALAAILLIGCAAYFVSRRYAGMVPWLDRATRNWRHLAVFGLILAAGLFFASRPLWFQPLQKNQNEIVAAIQQAQGYGIEPRTYAELTPYWVSWYIGPVIAGLGLLGLAAASYKGMRDRKMVLLPLLAVVVGTCLVYFVAPSITPDQPWASRRMLPVVMPGIALFGSFAAMMLFDQLKLPSLMVRRLGIAAVTVGIALGPLAVTAPFAIKPVKVQYPIVGKACETLPHNTAVIFVGMARLNMVQPMRTFCDLEAYNFKAKETDTPGKENLKEIAKALRKKGQLPVIGIYRDQYEGLIDKEEWVDMSEMPAVTFYDVAPTLRMVPHVVTSTERHLSFAVINDDGTLSKMPR